MTSSASKTLEAPKPLSRRSAPRAVEVAQRAGAVAAVLVLWWLLTGVLRVIPTETLPSPAQVWDGLVHLIETHQLWGSIAISLRRALTGLFWGGLVGISLGLLTGLTGWGNRVIDPLVQMLRTIPVLALAPLFIIWFGVGETPKVILIAVATLFPLYVNTHGGIRSLDHKIKEASWVFGVSKVRFLFEIVLPAALPQILVGLRLSLGISLLALVFAEQINADSGLGFILSSAQNYFQNNIVIVCVILYAFWGLLGDGLVRLLDYVLLPWRRSHNVR
jgi:sulfonate transport system permease protein